MCVPVTSWREVSNRKRGHRSGGSTKIDNIDNHELPCFLRVEERKYKMRAAKARVQYLGMWRQFEFQELLYHCRSEPVIPIQGISTPRHYDLGIQHMRLTG